MVLASIAGHHLKADQQGLALPQTEAEPRFSVLLDDPDVAQILDEAARSAGLEHPPRLGSQAWNGDIVFGLREQLIRSARAVRAAVQSDETRWRLLAAVRAGLIAADAAGSAIVRQGLTIEKWIEECFGQAPFRGADIQELVIHPRIREIEQRRGRPFRWHEFQEAAAGLGPRAVLCSPCGSGKTLAAWRWSQAQLDQCPAGRVIFLYPTRATATEGFRDYVSWAGGEVGALVHATADFDIEGMFSNVADPRHGETWREDDGLYALSWWPKRIFSATVDQFLAFLRFQYSSICMLPVLADSVVVIDEVHSFDRSMFSSLEAFLKFFDVPVLCMTATLTRDRRRLLAGHCCMQAFSEAEDRFKDLQRESEAGRYRITCGSRQEALGRIPGIVERGGRVLVWRTR